MLQSIWRYFIAQLNVKRATHSSLSGASDEGKWRYLVESYHQRSCPNIKKKKTFPFTTILISTTTKWNEINHKIQTVKYLIIKKHNNQSKSSCARIWSIIKCWRSRACYAGANITMSKWRVYPRHVSIVWFV